MRFCLNMIVKNEMVNLERALNSVAPHISCYAILDTGSTDGTQAYIQDFFKERSIPGVVLQSTFVNFEQARNEALDLARNFHGQNGIEYDYMLLMDADMELVADVPLLLIGGDTGPMSVALLQQQGSLKYYNTRLLHRQARAEYIGVTHEYLSCDHTISLDTWWFKDHATGSNRKDKIKRDIRLLKQDVKDHPNRERSWFYLGNTYKDNGEFVKALRCYEKRIAIGGWDEEVWHALLCLARCHREMKNEKAFILTSLSAYNLRPTRAEPLYDLAHYHRVRGENAIGWMYADQGSRVPYPRDLLFVESNIYDHGFTEEKSITGFYQDRTRKEGFSCCERLALSRTAPAHVRELARGNLYHYLRPLSDYAKSWQTRRIGFFPGAPVYTSTNPSIVMHNGRLVLNVRSVNYKIRPDGSYDMQGDDAIKTTNYILPLAADLAIDGAPVEIQRPSDWGPPEFNQVLGLEDIRLISNGGHLFGSATVREQNADGACEQFLFEINRDGHVPWARKMATPSRYGFQHEKNWAPIIGFPFEGFMYRPGVVVIEDGGIVHDKVPKLDVDHFSGGSQLLPWEGGWVGLIHEARMDPAHGYTKRYYQHRFVFYSHTSALQKVSKPFFFEGRQIEFCCGMAKHSVEDKFVITYSCNDNTAMIATISDSDLREFLWHG